MEIISDVFDPLINHVKSDNGMRYPIVHAAMKHDHHRRAVDFAYSHLPRERPPFINAKVPRLIEPAPETIDDVQPSVGADQFA